MTDDTTNDETANETSDENQLTIRRTFDATLGRVYRAFTAPDEFERWFVPEGMTAEVLALEPEPGGEFAVSWTDGENRMDNEGTYVEVVENERLVAVEETPGGELRLTYEFRGVEDGTELVLTQEFPGPVPDGAAEDWASMLDTLEELLQAAGAEPTKAEERSMTVDRVIEAPPEQVDEAFVDPKDLAQWLPPEGFSGEVHEFDATEGGTFRMAFTADIEELEPYASTFHGTYEELTPGERIVYTEEFESDDPGMTGEMTTTVTFEEIPDGTEITVRQVGIPEAIPPENANEGRIDSLENLAEVVEET